MEDDPRQAASENEKIHDAVTFKDSTTFSVPLPDVYRRFAEAGVDRSLRTLQRYCEHGHLHAAKYPTETGAVWYVDPESIETKIKEIQQVQATAKRPSVQDNAHQSSTNDTSWHDVGSRGVSPLENRGDTEDMASQTIADNPGQQCHDAVSRTDDGRKNSTNDQERQIPTGDDDKYVTVPVAVLEALTEQLVAKDDQLKRQDAHFKQLAGAQAEDRRLLIQALAIIHRDDFPPELGDGNQLDWNIEPTQAEELKPDLGGDGGNPQARKSDFGV